MSTINSGPSTVTSALAFALDPSVSAGFIKTPKQITDCITWFDADDLSTITTESGSRNVRYWADKSGRNLVLTGGGLALANEPLSVIGGLNGRNTVRCDGGDYLSCAFTTTYTEFTIFYVFKGNESNNSRSHILSVNNAGASSGNFEFDLNDNYGSAYQTMWVYWNGGGSPHSVIGLTSPNTKSDFLQGSPTLFTFSHTNSGSGTNIIYVNGRTRSDQINSSTQTITLGGAGNSLFLGARLASGLYYTGDICEVIIYSRQLSATERSQVQNYLSNKWRIPLLQTTLTNRDLIFGKVATCQNNNIPVIDKSYRVNPANATGSPLQSNFYFADSVSWMNSIITTSITLEAWVKPNSFTFFGNNTDLGTIMIANNSFYISLDGNGKFNAYLVGSVTSTPSHLPSTTSVTRHAWNHVVWTYDGAYFRWYLNGVLDKISPSTYTLGTLTVTNNLGIGSEGAGTFGRFLDGYIANCKVYGKALSRAEINQNYESSKTEFSNLQSIPTSGLVRYYDADVYSSYIGSGTSLVDLTGTSNATISNSPAFFSTDPKNFVFVGSSNHYFTLSSAVTSNETTIIIWARTSAARFLFLSGQTTSYYIMATDGGGAWYSQNAGTPTYYVDTVLSSDPTTSNALDNQYHMFEMRKADFSTWSTNIIGYYASSSSFNFTGNIAAVLIYNRNITSTESSQIYNYFKYRFGK